ncbi:fungal-specific transcription factor domain-containing protein [Pyrenochaeta sp. MPI-SDFR-AT-0127]|nr:fungal-specific transcription factor domain-containing protein [Pyrenochaeta sp. MPI-SDFR-AT-0127]
MATEAMSTDIPSAKDLRKDSLDVKPVLDIKDQSTPEKSDKSSSKEKSSKPRHRASVACATCRDRRIRCVVPPGDKECTQCKRSGVECIIKNDDERRRPISRAYMCSLTERVALLETMLQERGEELPPANHPPKTRHGPTRSGDASSNRKPTDSQAANNDANSSPGSQTSPQDDYPDFEHHEYSGSPHNDADSTANSPSMLPPPKKDGMVNRLLSTRGHLSFDQLSGRLRYFGPTTNCHVHSETLNPFDATHEISEQARRADKIIRSLPLQTYDYLMDMFWQCYNPVIHVLHQEAFNEDREMGRTQFYSPFLHVCVLAMGFRSADKERPDIRRISMPSMESTLHREAKYMLDHELERPGGIPSVVALLLLGDLECGVGRDNLGWMYGGMAVRLAFDIGLHLDTRLSGLPEREIEIRQMTLWACVIYDKYWALFLGRPTSMKSSDLEIYHLTKQFERLGTCRPAGPEKSMETMIYEALLDLMELAGKITENMDPHRSQNAPFDSHVAVDRNQYLRMAALDREFSSWYARLPEQLRWTPSNIATAPFSFFLLHQQYHASLILLHRPFALYEDQAGNESGGAGPDDHFSALSRTVCTKHAIRVARIYWQHRQRFDTKQIFITGMQHAGTAATALVAALAFIKDPNDRNNNMQYLECLSAALSDMAATYQPAECMSVVLRAVMVELRGGPEPANMNSFKLYKPKSAVVPARRGSTIDMDDAESGNMAFKKRQTSRPRAGTASSRSKVRTSSMSITMSMPLDHHHGLSIKPPPPLFDDLHRDDGFILITPRSELSTWPPLSEPPELSHTLSTPSTITSTSLSGSSNPRNSGAWMGADYDPQDSISQLANAHFPELNAFDEAGGAAAGGGMDGMTNLDFMNLGEGNHWSGLHKDWSQRVVGSDLDGFPSQNGFDMGFGAGNG